MDQSTPSPASAPLVDYGALCLSLRAAFEPARTHAISLHDEQGDVLWLSEGTMGPDEHNVVREAIEAFADPASPPLLGFDLGDSRCAVMVRTIDARCTMVGAVMVVMDSRAIARGAARLMTPKLQRALTEFAATRPARAPETPAASRAAAAAGNAPAAESAFELRLVETGPQPLLSAAPAAPAIPAPARTTTQARSTPAPRPTQVARSKPAPRPTPVARATPPRAAQPPTLSPLTTSPAIRRAQQGVTPELDRLQTVLRKSPIRLYVQRLMPLIKGSILKRYEVLLRSSVENSPNAAPHGMLKAAVDNDLGSMIDRRVIRELIGWLVQHPALWQNNEAMFSVNLTSTALKDDHLIKFVDLCLTKSALTKGCLAFEIDTATALTVPDRIAEVAAALHRLGCPLVLDDFALRTECIALLRLPGVRYVKLAPDVTANMRTDKISQAAITAVVQMARVLGMHTVAKHTNTAVEQEWLTALGVDFVQSNLLSPPIAIESLQQADSRASRATGARSKAPANRRPGP